MKNGGILGPKNNISRYRSNGIFGISEQYSANRAGLWERPINRNGLAAYLDANDPDSYPGSGRTWFDISGNGRNFTWNATPSFTSGNINFFSTLGNVCRGPASNSFGINNTSGYTIFVTALQNSLVATAGFKFYSTNGSGSAGRGIFSHMTWSDDVVYFDQGGCCNADTRTSVGSGGSQTWNIWTFQRDTNGSTRRIYKNGSVIATNTNAAANINLSSTAMDLGGADEYGGTSSTWNARLNSFVAYNRGLSATEISEIYQILRLGVGI